MTKRTGITTLCLLVFLWGCAPGSGGGAPDTGGAPEDLLPGDTDLREAEIREPRETPVADPDAAARAFRLYYRERVERAALSYNRFMLAGDVSFGTTIGKVAVARQGDLWEMVTGPNDNNHIGVSIWRTWNAWKVFRTRTLDLTLLRMFRGLVFFEAVSGHPGMTARMVYPGWTLEIDQPAGLVQRTRGGETVQAPDPGDPALEAEILETLFSGFRGTWRLDPEDNLLSHMPAAEVGPYAVTYSFSMLPDYLRVSDCCTSLMRTPAPQAWEGAYWGNHNSRDNFPDLATGYLVARAVMDDASADADLRAAAADAWEAGQRIGDLIQDHGGRLMTVDEHNPYDTLVVAGGVRPDGEVEAEDLGSLSDCQMVFLARALSSEGLTLPLPELPAPGSLEFLFSDFLGAGACPIPTPVRTCTRLQEAYCGKDWGNIDELELMGKPWLEIVEELEAETPGAAKQLIEGFQDDFNEKNIAILALVFYAQVLGDDALLAAAREAQRELTDLMRRFATLLYAQTDPSRLADRLYEAALFDAQGGREIDAAELGTFAPAETQIARIEAMLELEDTPPDPLLTDAEILQRVEDRLSGASGTVQQRYLEHYGETPPLRRTEDGYEARSFHGEEAQPWQPVETPHHRMLGGVHFLEALPLCNTAPQLLDCTWARLGCARPDLDGSGAVDDADRTLFEAARTTSGTGPCDAGNAWCQGADLDRTGAVDETDAAFMEAAAGCRYDPATRR